MFGGHTGPTGRPLSLLSFLLDGNNWPTDAWPFKRTNLVIHLFNGALLGVVTFQILHLVGIDKHRSQWLALLSAACWLLHPFLVSTTLYVVQRMAQLSTMFIFLGIIFYLRGRGLVAQRPAKAYATMSLALGLGTFLAMISKENGILLPLLVAVLEFTLVAGQKQHVAPLNRTWAAVFLLAPTLVVVSYLAMIALTVDFFNAIPPRDFSTYERLLTESRVLADYLQHWFLPKLFTAGVFQDHFLISSGFLTPLSTALSMVFHVSLISVGVVKRHKWPLFSFAVLFFYASHLLESTVVNLELYFEHRNYLAAAFLYLPLMAGLQKRISRPLFTATVFGILIVLAGFTRYTTTVWESYPSIVEMAASKVPGSARAQQQYSLLLYNAQRYDESLQVADAAIERIPGDEQLRIWRATIRCNLGMLSAAEFSRMKQVVATARYDLRALALYETLVNSVVSKNCPGVSLDNLRSLFTEMLQEPLNADPRSAGFSQIVYFVGIVDIHQGNRQRAMSNFVKSLRSRPGASRAMLMASLMASNEFYVEAMELSEIALIELDATHNGLLHSAQVTESDIRDFREKVREELRLRTPDPNGV